MSQSKIIILTITIHLVSCARNAAYLDVDAVGLGVNVDQHEKMKDEINRVLSGKGDQTSGPRIKGIEMLNAK